MSPLPHLGEIGLRDEGLAEGLSEELDESREILVAFAKPEDAGAAIAIKRLQDDVALVAAEGREFLRIAGDEGGRHELAVAQHEEFLRRVPHFRRIVHHQRLGMNGFEHVRGGDVVHVEGRILAHVHHVITSRDRRAAFRPALRDCPARRAPRRPGQWPTERRAIKGERIGVIAEDLVAAGLRFEHQREGRIALDGDALDGVHLEGGLESHGRLFSVKGILDVAGPQVGGDGDDVKTAEGLGGDLVPRHPACAPPRRCASIDRG